MTGLTARIGQGLATLLDWARDRAWRRSALIAAVAIAMLTPGISALPVTDRDEGRFVQASKQMLETGDPVDIRLQDKPRWKKPAGIYWLQAASAAAFGGPSAPIWAYRLPSLAGAVLAAVLLGWAVRPAVGPRAALLAGMMLPGCLLVAGEANIAKTDAVLLATAVAVLGGLVRLLPEGARPPRPGPAAGPVDTAAQAAPATRPHANALGGAGAQDSAATSAAEGAGGAQRPGVALVLGVWTALAAAILVKGPIVPAIAGLALIWLWIAWRRAPPLGRLRPVAGLSWTVLLVAPWLIAIWVVTDGAFFAESVGKDLMGKLAEGQEKHWGPPGLYLALVWLTFWPWAALLVPAAPWLWANRREGWLVLLAGWVVPFWLVLEAAPTKLPHYVLPLYPALLAVLAAWALAPDRPAPSRRWRRIGAWLVALPGGLLALAMIALPPVLEGRVAPLAALAALAALPLLWLAARAALADRPLGQIGASLAAAFALQAGTLGSALPALETVFASPRIAALAAPWMPCASGPLISAGYREPSLVFLTGTETRLPGPGEAARRLAEDPGALVLVEDRWLERHLRPAWGDAPPELIERGRLDYFNYNRGSFETARLWTRDHPRWAPCAGALGASPPRP